MQKYQPKAVFCRKNGLQSWFVFSAKFLPVVWLHFSLDTTSLSSLTTQHNAVRYAEGGRLYNCLTNFFYKIILRLKQVIFSTINIVLLASTNLQSVVFVFHAGKCKICFPKSRIEYMRERAGSGCILFRVLQLKLLFILLLWCVGHPQKPTRVQSWFQLKHCTPQTNTGEYFQFDCNVI